MLPFNKWVVVNMGYFNIFLGIVATLSTISLGWIAFHKNDRKDVKSEASEDGMHKGEVLTKLDFISNDLKEIKADQKSYDRNLSRVEAKVDNNEKAIVRLHERVDSIEGKK